VVEIHRGVVDGGYYEVADSRGVLGDTLLAGLRGSFRVLEWVPTRPPLDSTQIAFLRASLHSWPETVEVIVLGGIWRRPGPSFRGRVTCVGMSSGSR
jgi:hypothetical protein